MAYGIGTKRTSFGSMQHQYSQSAIGAASAMKPGSKTEIEKPDKTPGGALSSAVGMGLAGAKVAGMVGGGAVAAAGGLGSAAVGGGVGTTVSGSAAAGAGAGPWGIAIGAMVGLAAYYLS